ncbi:histidinol-phosphate transaminase [Pseudohaliea rubra]|uniref:Histidinol-phosphate aminotransferase n=1 Tax=Pseudohaliea rubra DSM 19751 TaxID=1265313 RepID=A0A095VQN7_9GAMM|nr:histidinol-phosphate transaminase [Pseudohaliea rubra]KGE03428.1 Histidinol-phosphate aminotransferase [Pseudohaliea rubra DSM 19751]
MSRFWSEVARGLSPYVPGEQPRHPRLVKLNTNESPYGPSPRVLAAVADTDGDSLRRYPDPDASALRAIIAAEFGLAAKQVFVGNGSDEVLAHTFLGLLKHPRPLAFPDISYSFYPVWCGLYGIEAQRVPLDAQLAIDVDAFPADCGGIILPNPNAPTGRLLGLDQIERLIAGHSDCVVVVDEAYIDFGGESAAALVDRYPNLLVVQTLSKSRALAGLRVGFALGDAQLIEGLDRVKDSFNSYPLDAIAQRAAVAAFEDRAWFEDCRRRVVATRERVAVSLGALGFALLPSAANFLFARVPGGAARALFTALREEGIIVRYFDRPRIDEYLRISIGTDEEMDRLLAAVEAWCGVGGAGDLP